MAQRINFRLKRLLHEEFFGDFDSRRRGFEGYEIEGIRPYQSGDPPQAIHPRLSARRGQPTVKITRPPTGFTGHFICDFSRSMNGKRSTLLSLVEIIADHISDNNAHFACSIVTSQPELQIPAGCGTAHTLNTARALTKYTPKSSIFECGSIGTVLRAVVRPPRLVFILTDLLLPRDKLIPLRPFFMMHDVIFCVIREPAEGFQKPLRLGSVYFVDVETGTHGVGHVAGAPESAEILGGLGVDWQMFSTLDDETVLVQKLIQLFDRRRLRAMGNSQKGGGA